MKTKVKILSALIGLASIGATVAQAQAVYSQNVVGYVNSVCGHGYTLIVNPLNTTNNTVSTVLAAPPEGTRIFKWTGHGYSISTFDWDDNAQADIWDFPATTINPGEGFFVFNPNAAFTNTFVGEVLTGNLTNVVNVGYTLTGSQVPQAGALDSVLNYVPTEGDRVYFYRNGHYVINTYDWDDNAQADVWDFVPTPSVGEGFFIFTATSSKWTRNFVIP